MNQSTNVKRWMCVALTVALALIGGVSQAKDSATVKYPPRKVKVVSELNAPVLLAGGERTFYLKVSLTGFEREESERTPVNVAVVFDKSESMNGEKIQQARLAAIEAVDRLRGDDIFSFVTYDSNVQVVTPATKVTDRESIIKTIQGIQAGGSTALYGGVKQGGDEVKKFSGEGRFDSIVLLSDGMANVGPQSPAALGELGLTLIKDGISVSTIGIGLGFNEDLMTKLAQASDGNHYFAKAASDIEPIFNPCFGGAMAVVAQDLTVTIDVAEGVRPVRVLGRDATIKGQKVTLNLNQIYSEHEKFVLLELEAPEADEPGRFDVAHVQVDYLNMVTDQRDHLEQMLDARFTDSKEIAEKSINKEVMVTVVEQIASEKNEMALELRDKGQVEAARRALSDNALYLRSNAASLSSPKLERYARDNEADSKNLDNNWNEQRKVMKGRNFDQQKQNY